MPPTGNEGLLPKTGKETIQDHDLPAISALSPKWTIDELKGAFRLENKLLVRDSRVGLRHPSARLSAKGCRQKALSHSGCSGKSRWGKLLDMMPGMVAEKQETPEEYRARLAGYVAGKDVLELQREAPRTLARLIEGIPEEALRRRPAPKKWSVVEIIAHLAEDELTSTWRYRQMIEHNGAKLLGFDQDEWARLGDYASWNINEALEMFRLLREANLRMLAILSPEEWECAGEHAERGKLTVRELARHMAAHDMNHIEQIERLLAHNRAG